MCQAESGDARPIFLKSGPSSQVEFTPVAFAVPRHFRF